MIASSARCPPQGVAAAERACGKSGASRGGADSGSDPPDVAAGAGSTRLRALVVDGNADTADSLATSLALDGHDTRIACTGADACRIADTFCPHVVLVEIWLPDIDGYEVVRRLRAAPATAGALLVAITDPGDVEARERAIAAGCDEHLARPFALDQLCRLARSAAARAAILTRAG